MINSQIKDRISGIKGSFSIYYKDLNGGFTYSVGDKDIFVASGMSKIFLLVEVFRQINDGIISKKTKYILKEEDKVPSIGAIVNLHEGIELNIEDLYKLMMTVGDNTAFNVLLKICGFENVNSNLISLGFQHSIINRYLFDKEKIEQGVENCFSITEAADFFERLYLGQLISKKISTEIIELLKLQQRDHIIPYHFSDLVSVAHHLGIDDGIIHDCGIIFSKNPFILCMASNDVDVRMAEGAMRDIAIMCLKFSNRFN